MNEDNTKVNTEVDSYYDEDLDTSLEDLDLSFLDDEESSEKEEEVK